jgi:hypothetical protein
MPKSVAISLLRKASTGDQMLQVLDSLLSDSDEQSDANSAGDSYGEPTGDWVEF